MNTTRRALLVFALATAAVVAAGCSSSSKSTSVTAAAPTTTAAPTPTSTHPAGSASKFAAIGAAAPSSFTVTLAKSSQGIFLIDSAGHSLYVFDKDQGTTSACTGDCAKTWPAASAPSGAITSGPSVTASQMGSAHGQLTYYGHLLYSFSGDTAPGQTNGVGTPDWNLIGPFGNVMLPRG